MAKKAKNNNELIHKQDKYLRFNKINRSRYKRDETYRQLKRKAALHHYYEHKCTGQKEPTKQEKSSKPLRKIREALSKEEATAFIRVRLWWYMLICQIQL